MAQACQSKVYFLLKCFATVGTELIRDQDRFSAARAEAGRLCLACFAPCRQHGFNLVVALRLPPGTASKAPLRLVTCRARRSQGIQFLQDIRASLQQLGALHRVVLLGDLAQLEIEIEFLQGVEQALALGQ